ncbi:helix-turn-helix domain-containing protein [Streptosporangium roseum]|uniref:AraC family transcriptional regulator n=1 Tax=Streptosporangium roseum (strain ATCC 12428 / DSM 43021 / JCM 3005 / KCTC 9067 / NCIMB 10171 / NRRL 2505 / NI 9100) TaxID=479432 RepID=D2AYD4_STRRD|nr:AraC family transcriptional regulator [Streptosporangium roseum]ACZ87144.1 AraC family transcriptional regulator [Streptosporangium roseum DSM 43021]
MGGTEQTRRRGILNPRTAAERFRLTREPAPPDLARSVDGYWILHWDLTRPHRQRVLTDPTVHLSFATGGRARITGVVRGTFTEEISGAGRVVGVRFRPGGFRPFLKAPVSTLTGRVLDIEEVFGPAARTTADAIIAEPSVPAALELAAGLLRSRQPEPDPAVDEAAGLVAAITGDPSILRVSQLATATGVNTRRLQRLFAEYVGAGPKWVIRRARMQEAAARAAAAPQDWSTLAAELGYADQAHFTRDFTASTGTSPARYSWCARAV